MLCMHNTTILCQFGLFVTSLPTHISINSHPFPAGIVSRSVPYVTILSGLPRATTMPQPSNAPVQPADPQQDLQMLMEAEENKENHPALPHPAPPTAQQLPQPQLEQPPPAACQMHSSRVIWNTPRYEQSVSQWSQGLVAWEVLLDQD